MGTGHPHVEIAAATLAGGDKNQDRYAYGDGWAFVLDGASSFARTQHEHDGGWYAEHLKQALSKGLKEHSERPTPEIVEDAIRSVAEAHGGDVASCPTSTIALARWDDKTIEVYLLGDSTIALISDDAEEVLSDARLANIASPARDEYRSRLSDGCGFDMRHRELLQRLQAHQATVRNQPGGYWIAGAEPKAAHRGLVYERPVRTLQGIVLATDGAAAGLKYGTPSSWRAYAAADLEDVVKDVQRTEANDPYASRWPRSKPHDDKTVVVVTRPHSHLMA